MDTILILLKIIGKFSKKRAIYQFHTKGSSSTGCNATFIILIQQLKIHRSLKEYRFVSSWQSYKIIYNLLVNRLKKSFSKLLKEYRLISLVDNLNKIIYKLLANRLKKYLLKVINKTQSTFLVSKNLLDSILVTNELWMIYDLRREVA